MLLQALLHGTLPVPNELRQPIAFGGAHLQELPTAREHAPERAGRVVRQGPHGRSHAFAEQRQEARIDAISLC